MRIQPTELAKSSAISGILQHMIPVRSQQNHDKEICMIFMLPQYGCDWPDRETRQYSIFFSQSIVVERFLLVVLEFRIVQMGNVLRNVSFKVRIVIKTKLQTNCHSKSRSQQNKETMNGSSQQPPLVTQFFEHLDSESKVTLRHTQLKRIREKLLYFFQQSTNENSIEHQKTIVHYSFIPH